MSGKALPYSDDVETIPSDEADGIQRVVQAVKLILARTQAKSGEFLAEEHDDDLAKVVPLFLRTGFTMFAGYLVGGMKAWDNAGLPLGNLDQMTVHEVQAQADELQILDVRSPGEWKKGHIPGAKHIFLPEVPKKSGELSKQQPVAVYCDSGYRASLAASILKTAGFDVRNVPGSWPRREWVGWN